MQPLGRFIRGLWHALDTLRRFLHLLLLLALLGLVIGALRQAVPRIPDKAALLVRPSGELVEQLSGEPIERAFNEAQGEGAPQTLLWDLTTAIRAAATDPRIVVLVLDTDQMSSSGQVKLEELAAAIADFRRSGKKVIAHGTYFLQSQYYLAAQADELYLDPLGFGAAGRLFALPDVLQARSTSSASTCICSGSASSRARPRPTRDRTCRRKTASRARPT